MGLSFIIEMVMTIIRGFLTNSTKAAPYAKWLLRIRDYLTLLFPQETYPPMSTEDLTLQNVKVKPVPVDAVKAEVQKGTFTLPPKAITH